jgi:hypothetical protein
LFCIVPFYFLLDEDEEDLLPLLLEPLEDLLPLPLDEDFDPLLVLDFVPVLEPLPDLGTGLKSAGGFWADLGGTTTGGRTDGVDVIPLRVHEYWLFAMGL